MMKRKRQVAVLVQVFVFSSIFAGCTHVYKAPVNLVKVDQQREKIPLNVELRLSDELHNAKWEKHIMGDTFIIPLGDALTQNAESIARHVFTEVAVTQGANNEATSGGKAMLTPKMVLAERTMGATAFGASVLSVILEWKLEDRMGNTIWIDTVKGESEENTGNIFTHKSNARKQIEECMTNLFQNSYQALSSSVEIMEFAKKIETDLTEKQASLPKIETQEPLPKPLTN